MSSRAMVALEKFPYPYGTRDLVPGDTFEAVSDADAVALRLAGRAKDAEPADSAAAAKKPAATTYKRRDLTAAQ